jgi:hypothetical protein
MLQITLDWRRIDRGCNRRALFITLIDLKFHSVHESNRFDVAHLPDCQSMLSPEQFDVQAPVEHCQQSSGLKVECCQPEYATEQELAH